MESVNHLILLTHLLLQLIDIPGLVLDFIILDMDMDMDIDIDR